KSSLDERAGRADEPYSQRGDRSALPLRQPPPASPTHPNIPRRLQLRQASQDFEWAHAVRIRLSSLDKRTQSIQIRSGPAHFGTTHLVGRTCGQNYSHRCSWLIPAQPTHAEAAMPMSPVIEITYCRLCGWGLRAGWMAQELLTTFADELGSVTLTPDRTGGVFEVRVDDEV